MHCKRGELFTEFIREGCREHLDGTLCDYCSSHHWIGPELSRVPQPVPDQANPPHFLPVWRTPLNNGQGKPRSVDDYQPRAQISRFLSQVHEISRTMRLLRTSQCNMRLIAI